MVNIASASVYSLPIFQWWHKNTAILFRKTEKAKMVNISCSIYLWCCTLQIYFTMHTFYSEFSKQLLFSAPTSGSFETLHNETSL